VSEILTRSDGVFADIDFKERLIDVIAVPWEQEARVFWRGDWWTEVFERGAFNGVESRAGQIRVNREHVKGDTVGKIIELDPTDPRGLFARIRIVPGPKGDEVLNLAKEDMISASIGYRTSKGSDVMLDKDSMLRRVKVAFLDHLGMVEDPAFKQAQVLAVREDAASGVVAEGPLPATPALDEFLRDPVMSWVMEQRRAS
jgi:HK97 family phage prohead protease